MMKVFGIRGVPCGVGNKAIVLLQRRRKEGTLDLDLPPDITEAIPQAALDHALEWLREGWPLDEDAAILKRIEREEQEAEERLIHRAEELGLYKPQSGHWGAEKVKEGDVYGKSVLEETRNANIKRAKEIEEEERRTWLEGEVKDAEKLKAQLQGVTHLEKYKDLEAAIVEGNYTSSLSIFIPVKFANKSLMQLNHARIQRSVHF
jgi:rhomboid-like protein